MPKKPFPRSCSRRTAIAAIASGATGVALSHLTTTAMAEEATGPAGANANPTRYPTVSAMKSHSGTDAGEWAQTDGFHRPGDGGAAFYHIRKTADKNPPNDADVISLNQGFVAVLQENQAVNYKMFGATGDGERDDGVQIKQAHEYANNYGLPIVNPSGEFWIKQTNDITIRTPVFWGNTKFHIDERYNDRQHSRFVVRNDRPSRVLELDEPTKAALVEKLRPGVQIVPELAPYAGHLISVEDREDRIGIRAGGYNHRGWAREELFYVEEEGRIIGDIAWEFKDLTTVRATPCNDNYLVIEGGGFYFSGETPEGGEGAYHFHGISIHRSRTIVREQWMGLEPGKRDVSMAMRRGFYVFNRVFDVTLENIRAMPWEKNRPDRDQVVRHGTYGIGGRQMLNCTFRNLTAEGGPVAWGVFGTNINKNFRLENCRLNRVDVHFHCWNLYIRDCAIGFRGVAVTGGGDLFIENTSFDANYLIDFRRDYGGRWDGNVRLRGCTLRPRAPGSVSVLQHRLNDFDYQYPIGYARRVKIEDLVIDYAAVPESTSPCWLMEVVPFSRTSNGDRLFFPQHVEFRNISVQGREQGVRLVHIPEPQHYDMGRKGSCDDVRLKPNCTMVFDRVQLESLTPDSPGDPEPSHLALGGEAAHDYADEWALYPKIVFTDCENVALYLGHCAAAVHIQRCAINTVTAPGLRGELTFDHCRFQPQVRQAAEAFNQVESTLGTRFTNCTLHAPVVDGQAEPELVDQTGILKINAAVRHYHLNTALGNDILNHLKTRGTRLDPDFIAKLKSRHVLES